MPPILLRTPSHGQKHRQKPTKTSLHSGQLQDGEVPSSLGGYGPPGAAGRQQRLVRSAVERLNSTIPAEHVAVITTHRRYAMTGNAKKSAARNMHSRQHHRQRITNASHRVWAGSTCDARPRSLCAAAGSSSSSKGQRQSLAAPSGQTSESGKEMVSTTPRSLSGATERGPLSSTVPPFPPGFVAPNPPSTQPSNSSTGTGTPSTVAFPLPLAN